VAVLGILSRCQSLQDLERFAIRRHSVLTEALGIDLRRPPSVRLFATSSAKWTWQPSALRSVTGRSPRSQVVLPILISSSCQATAKTGPEATRKLVHPNLSRKRHPPQTLRETRA